MDILRTFFYRITNDDFETFNSITNTNGYFKTFFYPITNTNGYF